MPKDVKILITVDAVLSFGYEDLPTTAEQELRRAVWREIDLHPACTVKSMAVDVTEDEL